MNGNVKVGQVLRTEVFLGKKSGVEFNVAKDGLASKGMLIELTTIIENTY